MKKHQIYLCKETINEILMQQKNTMEAGLVYVLIKNLKLLQNEINTYQQMFNVKQIEDYNLFIQKRQNIISKYK